MNPIDAGILIVLLAGLVVGAVRGLARLLVGAVGFVLSLAAAIIYHGRLAAYLESSWGLTARISAFLATRLTLPPGMAGAPPTALTPGLARQLTAFLRLPEPYASSISGYFARLGAAAVSSGNTAGPTSLNQLLATTLARAIVDGLAFVLIIGLISLAFRLLEPMLAGALGFITGEGLNRLGGAVVGLAMAVTLVTLFLGFAVPFLAMTEYQPWVRSLASSRLATWFLQAFTIFGPWTAGRVLPK